MHDAQSSMQKGFVWARSFGLDPSLQPPPAQDLPERCQVQVKMVKTLLRVDLCREPTPWRNGD